MKRRVAAAAFGFLSAAGIFWFAAGSAHGDEGRGSMEVGWSDFASPEGAQIAFADALTAITDKASRDLLGTPVDRDQMRRYLKSLGWRVRAGIESNADWLKTAEVFRWVIFGEEGFVPDPDPAASGEPATAILSEVIAHKRGVCLSLSLLYLAVADEASIPLKGVSVPLHFFVRHESGGSRINFEMLDGGSVSRLDAFYRKKFFVHKNEPFYLQSLSQREALASYLSQLAAIYLRSGKAEEAIGLLDVAGRASARDPEIRTNLGLALSAAGRPDDAIEAWKTAIVLDEYDDVAHFNLARGYAGRGDWMAAIFHLDESMRLGHPVDSGLLRTLEPHRPDAMEPAV